MTPIDINTINIDGGTQARVELDKATVAEYRNAFLAGAEFPPVTVFDDGTDLWLCDGFHRMAGTLAAGHTTINAEVQPGTQRDAVLFSLRANATHGLRRSSADKRKAVGTLLADDEWAQWSNREIARAADVSESLVRHLRENADAPTERVVSRNGRTYTQDTSKIGKTPAAPAPVMGGRNPPTHPSTDIPATPASQLQVEQIVPPELAAGEHAPVDNAVFRALFSLPLIRESASTAPVVPEMPPQTSVTGDLEVDAVLWLMSVVDTGNEALIAKAIEAATRIKTPLKTLADRYTNHVLRTTGNSLSAAFASFGFGELQGRAKGAIEKAARRHEAMSRFGTMDALFAETPAETACKEALAGLKQVKTKGGWHEFDHAQSAARFAAHPTLAPATLLDVLHALDYGTALYSLRHAANHDAGDHLLELQEHEGHAFRMLARIPPRDATEALAVLDHLIDRDAMDRVESNDIVRNLIRGPRCTAHTKTTATAINQELS